MKKIIFLLLFVILNNCSFDNKTGIWKNSNEADVSQENRFKDFETLYSEEKTFNEIILPRKNLIINFKKIKKILRWEDEFYHQSNNLDNFSYENLNKLIFKSKKLSRFKIKDKILFDGNNIILSDVKGNIIVYSINDQEINFKYNFYKNKFKKLNKKLSIIVERNIIYVSDNMGYIYAINYSSKKLLWAKNFKIPFRSNLKLTEDYIILSDQNNSLLIVNKVTGDRVKIFPTEETTIKNDFINSIALNNDSILFLNTYGSFYSVDKQNFNINWLVNLNESIDLNNRNLFYSNSIIFDNKLIAISTDPYLYVINAVSGITLFKLPITSIVNPIISGNNLFLVTKDNLIVCLDLTEKKINYSLNINSLIAKFVNTKKKEVNIKHLFIAKDKIYLFLDNSYIIRLSATGSIEKIDKLKEKLFSKPIFVNDSILYINNKNKLIVLN